MNNEKDEKWLDEIISRAIGSEKLHFDAEKWEQKYHEEFQMLVSRSGGKSVLSKIQPRIWKIIVKSTFTRFAAAAVIVMAIGFLVIHRGPAEQVKTGKVVKVEKSPAQMMTMLSLSLAYRQGGLEAAEEQSRKALKLAGVVNLNIKQLQKELINNGGI